MLKICYRYNAHFNETLDFTFTLLVNAVKEAIFVCHQCDKSTDVGFYLKIYFQWIYMDCRNYLKVTALVSILNIVVFFGNNGCIGVCPAEIILMAVVQKKTIKKIETDLFEHIN